MPNDTDDFDFMKAAIKQWEHAGLNCVLRNCLGWINGYVQVPKDHIAYDVSESRLSRAIMVHGGLTYADGDGWFGFDTCHGGDRWSLDRFEAAGVKPTEAEKKMLEIRASYVGRDTTAWTLDLVVAETNFLAEQLAALTEIPRPDSYDIDQDELDALYAELDELRAFKAQHSA